MRTRNRSNLLITKIHGPGVVQQRYKNNVLQQTVNYNAFYGPTVVFHDQDTMIDDPSKGRHFKAVSHEHSIFSRRELNTDSFSVGAAPNDVWRYVTTCPMAHWETWGNYGSLSRDNIHVVWNETEEELIRKAVDRFYTTTEVEGLLNVVEAPELVTGLRSLYNNFLVDVVPYKGKIVKGRIRRGTKVLSSNDKFSRGTKVLSGGFLYYSFGVAPLISDMRKISKALEKYKIQLARYLKQAGAVYTVHEKGFGTVHPDLKPGLNGAYPHQYGSGPSDNDGKVWHTAVTAQVTPVRTVTIRGIRDIRFQSSVFQTIDYLIKRFGAQGPASFLWERIPFSFVVDWFVDLSGVLHAVDNALTGSSKRITDACISEKWKVLAPVIHHSEKTSHSSLYHMQQVAIYELSSYTRKPFIPTTSVGLSGRFGKKQGLLAGALLSQMAANLKAKR